MGRRKTPITGTGPLAQLARSLRDLRESSGLTLRELADHVGYSHSTLASAERGRVPPSWPVTDAFISGCGAAAGEWRSLWMAANAAQAAAAGAEGSQVVPAQLPGGVPGFVGRAYELAQLLALAKAVGEENYGPPLICSIEGMAGVGKTALALEFAHLTAAQFSDGQLFVNAQAYCQGGAPLAPRDVLIRLLRGLGQGFGTSAVDIDGMASVYRSITAGKKILVLLDNAQTADQVRAAIPGRGPGLVVATSRNALNGLIVRDGAVQLHLNDLADDDALALMAHIVTRAVVDASPLASRRVADLCGNLPLALRIAAHHVTTRRYQSLGELAEALACDDECLNVLSVNGDETANIRSVLSWSYDSLPTEAALAFRLIGERLSGRFDFARASEAIGGGTAHVQGQLRALIDANLLQEHRKAEYAAHRLVKLYAAEFARSARLEERSKAAG